MINFKELTQFIISQARFNHPIAASQIIEFELNKIYNNAVKDEWYKHIDNDPEWIENNGGGE